MAARGDWIVPIFNDELRGQKPVLTYWLILTARAVFGPGEFAARFWSAALATGTVVWTLLIARRLIGATRAPWAAIALSTFVMFDIAARAATPDSVLIFCFTSAIGCWVLATFAPNQEDCVRTWQHPGLRHAGEWFPRHLGQTLPIYAALGLGVLAKGPVGFVLPIAVIGMVNLLGRLQPWDEQGQPMGTLERRLRISLRPWSPSHFAATFWSMRPITGIAMVLVIAAPWYLAVSWRTDGDFLEAFLWREHVGRATEPMENHSGGVWYYPIALLVGTFPWSVLALPLVLTVDRTLSQPRAERPLILILALSWIGIVIAAFTLAQTKLPSYITPCHPAAALVIGWYVSDLVASGVRLSMRWNYAITAALAGVGLGMLIGVPVVASRLEPGLMTLGAIGLIPILGAAAWYWTSRREQPLGAPLALAGTAVVWSVVVFSFGSVAVDRHQHVDELLSVLSDQPNVRLASYGKLESTWVYYSGHPIFEIDPSVQGATTLERKNSWDLKPRPTLQTFLQAPGEPFVVTTADQVAGLISQSNGRLAEVARVDALLDDQPLVLLGPPTTDRTAWSEMPAVMR
jgi:4-amino-4-deoxy-L-arabinose transferase-like glycosyltransferase